MYYNFYGEIHNCLQECLRMNSLLLKASGFISYYVSIKVRLKLKLRTTPIAFKFEIESHAVLGKQFYQIKSHS